MSQSDRFDKLNGENDIMDGISDPYRSESSEDIYSTPDLFADRQPDHGKNVAVAEDAAAGTEEEEVSSIIEAEAEADVVEAETGIEVAEAETEADVVEAETGIEVVEAETAIEVVAETDAAGSDSSMLPVTEQNDDSGVIPYGSNPQQGNIQYNNGSLYEADFQGNGQCNSGLYGTGVQQGNTQYNNYTPYGKDFQGYGQYNNSNPHGADLQQGSVQYSNNSPYGADFRGNGQYNSSNPYGANIQQGNAPYNNGSPYGSDFRGNSQYNNSNPYEAGAWGNDQYNNNNPYGAGTGGNDQYNNNNPYGAGARGNSQYSGSNPYGAGPQQGNTQYNYNPYGSNPQWNNPYSPYAVPQKKNHAGLIIGIVIAVVVLFLIAVFALAYKAVNLLSEDDTKRRNAHQEYDFGDDDRYDFDDGNDVYDDFDDPFFEDYDDLYDHDGFYGNDFYGDDFYGNGQYPFGFDDFDGYDDGYDDRYYDLRDDVKTNLSYSVELENFEYDAGYENVAIFVTYPVIKGDQVPNLDKLNQTIQAEKDFFTEYFEEEYKDHITEEYSYFNAQSRGYVAYMDEEKMSIVFSESIYSDYYNDVYLYCINIDMENGIVLNNENLLNIDDAFSVEFRQKSDIQNDEIDSLTRMTDQEMTKLFNSPDVIVFYTPMGMEIGFNYAEGWVTVTYEDYEKYLKVL